MADGTQVSILIIEDERPVRDSYRNFLEDLEFTVLEAPDGPAGIALFEAHHPDVVILDLRMPKMSGHDVMRALSAIDPFTPMIVVSGTADIADTVEALHLGAWDYLLKPITDLNILENSIRQVLARARKMTENRKYQQQLEQDVERRTRELTGKMEEMTRFNKMAMGRERRIIELKRMINDLLVELGRPPKFKSPNLIEPANSPNE
ncbi:response regulator [Pontiella sp.]|uniref:response regulator n=1 Tax=Pontiella sp. TaxID=2837462 RepID=UPI00356171AB